MDVDSLGMIQSILSLDTLPGTIISYKNAIKNSLKQPQDLLKAFLKSITNADQYFLRPLYSIKKV